MTYIYVLELEDNKWYIGKTENLDYRLKAHKKGKGSEWTKLHKVKNVKEIINNGDEKITTLQYMKKYGVNNVRGYTWSQSFIFSPEKIKNILRLINYLNIN